MIFLKLTYKCKQNMGQDISLDDISEFDLELIKQYEGQIKDILPDEENPKWKVNIVISQDQTKPYFRLRTRKGEPVVKVRDLTSHTYTFLEFADFCLTGESETFPKPSSKDELRAFDDEVFVTGTRLVRVNLKNKGRARSIPDLATLRKKAKAPGKPKFFDKLLNLSKKTKSSGALCSPTYNTEGSSDEEDLAITFTAEEEKPIHKSIEEITSLDVEGSLLQQLEEDLKLRRLKSEPINTKTSVDGFSPKLQGKKSVLKNTVNTEIERQKQKEDSDSESDSIHVVKKKERNSSEGAKNIPLSPKNLGRTKSLDTDIVTQSTPNSPKASSAGIVKDRLARFRKLNEGGNKNSKDRRSMSVPSSPDPQKREPLIGNEHLAIFQKVRDTFRQNIMADEDSVKYGGVNMSSGYVKALVSQINSSQGVQGGALSVSPKSGASFKKDAKINDNKKVNGQNDSIEASQTSLNNNHVESPNSSNRNSIKSSECGGVSDTTTSSVPDKTENESGIGSDGISSINPAELFDSSWSESDIDSLHSTDSEDETCAVGHKQVTQNDSIDSKGSPESTEPPKDKIQKIVEELLSTEKAYVQRLKLLDQTFQFRVVQENKVHNFLPDGVIPAMFSNVQSIHQFHNDFLLPQIETRVQNWSSDSKIGDMMRKYAPLLKMYTEYVKNFDNAMNMITVWSEKSPKFAAIIKEIQMTPECGSLTLQHHMLEPVQRIPRYEMLLKDYLKRLPEDAADREDAQVALELVTTAACHSNEAMKKIDSFNKLLEIVRKIDTNENLISPTRELIREGRITKISARGGERLERFLFLFNDLLLICVEPLLGSYKIKSQIEMDGMEIMERSDKCLRWILEGESIDIPNTFYVKSRQKIIQFLDENVNGESSGWCEIIRKTIERYKRKKGQKTNSIEEFKRQSGMTDTELGKVAPKWIKDDEVTMCMRCAIRFTAIRRRHHCRACGDVVCGKCSSKKVPLRYDDGHMNRVCDDCYLLLNEDTVVPTKDKKDKKELLHINASDPSVLSGYVHMSSDKGKTWHKRWLAVHKNFAMYVFKAHQDPYAIFSLALPGHLVENIEKLEHVDRENIFRISSKMKSYLLSSETAASKERWISVLNKVVIAELPEEDDETSNRDSNSSNDSHENVKTEHSYL